MASQYQQISITDLSKGIDQRSSPNAIPEGFAEDLRNVITNSTGQLAKRPGYEGFYGYLPMRIIQVVHTGNQITFSLDSSIDVSRTVSSPIVVYGKLSGTRSGDWSTTNNGEYYTSFTDSTRTTLTAALDTVDVPQTIHGVATDEVLIQIHQATNPGGKDNTLIIPSITIPNAAAFDVTVAGTIEEDISFYTLIAEPETGYVHGDVEITASTTADITITAGTHGLSNFNIIPQVYLLSGTDYIQLPLPDVELDTSTGTVTVSITNSDLSSIFIRVILSSALATNAEFKTITAGTTDTIVISTSNPFNFIATYQSVGTTSTLVMPGSAIYDEAAQELTITITNSGTSTQYFRVYWQEATIMSSSVTVTDNGDVSTNYTDTAPQLTMWGISHEDVYPASDYQEGHVNHIDTYRSDTQSRVIAGLGGNIFGSYTRSESDAGYLIPGYFVQLEAQVSGDTVLTPVFLDPDEEADRTHGNVVADNIVDNKAIVTAVEYVSSGVTKYTLSLTNQVGDLSDAINVTSAVADRLTVTGMAHPINNGTFKITAVDNALLTITVENSAVTIAEFNETGANGYAGIFTDQITLSANSKLMAGDTFSSVLFDGYEPTVLLSSGTTVVVTGITGHTLITSGTTLYPTRTTNVIPLASTMTNYVKGDMCELTGISQKVRVLSVNNSTDVTITSITSTGTLATVTATAHGLAVGDTVVLLRTGVVGYDIAVTVENVLSEDSFTFVTTIATSANAGVILGKTVTIDEEIEVYDDILAPMQVNVVGRWLPIEAPTTTDGLVETTYISHFDTNEYDQQTVLRSTMVNDTMYFTNQEDQVMKFDGTSIYQAGLFRWQPQLFCQTDVTVTSLALDSSAANVTATADGKFSVDVGEAVQFSAGDIVTFSANSSVYTIVTADVINDIVYVTPVITGGTTGTLKKAPRFKYYFRLNAIDANKNVIASAMTDANDLVMDLLEEGQIKIRLVGMPVWGNYDYDTLELEVYRTKRGTAAPFYRIGVKDISFSHGYGYIDFTDSIEDEYLNSSMLDSVAIGTGVGIELGTGWTQPPRAKYVTSLDNRLVLANVKDYDELDIKFRSDDSLRAIDVANLSGKKLLFKKDTTDSASTTNMIDRVNYEFVTSGNHAIAPGAITRDSTSFTVTPAAGHTLVAGDWVYLYHSRVEIDNHLDFAGWWQVASVSTTVSFTIDYANSITLLTSKTVSAVNTGTDVITTSASHGLVVNHRVVFSGADLPDPLVAGTIYYVVSVPSTTEFAVSTTQGGTAVNLIDAGTGTRTLIRDWHADQYVSTTTTKDVPVWLGTDGNLGMVGANILNEVSAMTRLASAINATMRMTDTSLASPNMATFVPWMIASAGNGFGGGRVVIRQEKPFTTTMSVKLPAAEITGASMFVNGVKRVAAAEIDATTRAMQSRVLLSYRNYPEIFDRPFSDEGQGVSVVDVNSADGQEITGVIPFFGDSVFGQGTSESTLAVFKTNSIYLVDIYTRAKSKIQSRGLGCTAPHSIAATRDGIMFVNNSGIYRLNRDQSISYIGGSVERIFQDEVNQDQLDLLRGHHYGVGRQYKLSVPIDDETRNSQVLVYDHQRESNEGQEGAWSRFTNHPATGWTNLEKDAFFATTNGQVFKIRTTGTETDFRDDAAAVDEMVILLKANALGAPGSRKIIANVVSHFHLRTTSMVGTELEVSSDLDGEFESAGTFTLIKGQNNKVETVKSSLPTRRLTYIQLRYINSTKDEEVILAGIEFTASLLNVKGIKESGE